MRRGPAAFALALLAAAGTARGAQPGLSGANERLLQQLGEVQQLSAEQLRQVRGIFARSPVLGQGNPDLSEHPMTSAQCLEGLARPSSTPSRLGDPRFEQICGRKLMAPLYDPSRQRPEEARACIDQLEFPDIPCAYPVVWVRANEAAELCEAVGKRLCDAHEWEGACEGVLEESDYFFGLARGVPQREAVARMRAAHNRKRQAAQRWSYGPSYRSGVCGTASRKSPGCPGGGYKLCGSNTYPAGAFPDCGSPLGVYDLNGNAAEHMNLPLAEDQLSSRGSRTLGVTEMKGSWFVFDLVRAHPDWCRWRAPFWHGTRVLDPRSHANYHLGFRCCRSLPVLQP